MKKLNKSIAYPENLIREILDDFDDDLEITKDMEQGLNFVLTDLEEPRQAIIRMRYLDRLTFKQIGEILGYSETTVTNRIRRIVRKLRHPSYIRYIRNGLDYMNAARNEEEQRRERYNNISKNRTEGVLLSDMEEISVRTYNSLHNKGFVTLNEVYQFILENGKDWYRLIPDLAIRSKLEVEQAILLYGLIEN